MDVGSLKVGERAPMTISWVARECDQHDSSYDVTSKLERVLWELTFQIAALRQEMAEQWRWVRENYEREQTAAEEVRSRVATNFEQFDRGNLEAVLPFAHPQVGAADALRDGPKVADGIPRDAAGNEIKLD